MRINSVWFFFYTIFQKHLTNKEKSAAKPSLQKSKEANLMRNYIQHVKEQRDTRHFFPCAFPLS